MLPIGTQLSSGNFFLNIGQTRRSNLYGNNGKYTTYSLVPFKCLNIFRHECPRKMDEEKIIYIKIIK